MSAAPDLFGDPPISSPELALVDADLAAQLRADLSSGEAFQPRHVARPVYLSLVFDADASEPAEIEPPADDGLAELSAGVVDVPPAYVVLPEGTAEDVVFEAEDSEVEEISDHLELAVPDEPTDELPDYVVQSDDDGLAAPVPDATADNPDSGIGSVFEAVDEQPQELPDYIVQEDDVDAAVDVVPETDLVAFVPEYVVPAQDAMEDGMPEYVVSGPSEIVEDVLPDEAPTSDYPVLPDLEARSDALEQTEAALARIRAQLVVPEDRPPKPRVRRRFAIVSGLGVATALAAVALDVQLGVLHAPGWLGL